MIIKKVAPESIRIGSSGGWSPPERCLVASFGGIKQEGMP